jgi:hypothetical protein
VDSLHLRWWVLPKHILLSLCRFPLLSLSPQLDVTIKLSPHPLHYSFPGWWRAQRGELGSLHSENLGKIWTHVSHIMILILALSSHLISLYLKFQNLGYSKVLTFCGDPRWTYLSLPTFPVLFISRLGLPNKKYEFPYNEWLSSMAKYCKGHTYNFEKSAFVWNSNLSGCPVFLIIKSENPIPGDHWYTILELLGFQGTLFETF